MHKGQNSAKKQHQCQEEGEWRVVEGSSLMVAQSYFPGGGLKRAVAAVINPNPESLLSEAELRNWASGNIW